MDCPTGSLHVDFPDCSMCHFIPRIVRWLECIFWCEWRVFEPVYCKLKLS